MTIFNLVFVKHADNNKQFLFQAPLSVSLHKGDKVFVNTSRGEQEGVVANENFLANRGTMHAIAEGCGGYLPLKFVTGRAAQVTKQITTTEKIPFVADGGLPF